MRYLRATPKGTLRSSFLQEIQNLHQHLKTYSFEKLFFKKLFFWKKLFF